MTNKDKDQDWLDALAGNTLLYRADSRGRSAVRRPNADADPDVTQHASVLRQAIQRHDAALGLSEVGAEAGLQQLKSRLRREGLIETNTADGPMDLLIKRNESDQNAASLAVKTSSNPFAKSWVTIIASLISAFAFGVAVTRFAMLPTMDGLRSNGEVVEIKNQTGFAQKVLVHVIDPAATIQFVISEAIRLRLSVTANATSEGFSLLIEGLVSNSPEQDEMKKALGITKSASGNLLFQIQAKKPKN
jgi:hypothetical protein